MRVWERHWVMCKGWRWAGVGGNGRGGYVALVMHSPSSPFPSSLSCILLSISPLPLSLPSSFLSFLLSPFLHSVTYFISHFFFLPLPLICSFLSLLSIMSLLHFSFFFYFLVFQSHLSVFFTFVMPLLPLIFIFYLSPHFVFFV